MGEPRNKSVKGLTPKGILKGTEGLERSHYKLVVLAVMHLQGPREHARAGAVLPSAI